MNDKNGEKTYVYRPKMVTSFDDESTQKMLAMMEEGVPVQSENVDTNFIIKKPFLEKVSPVYVTTQETTIPVYQESQKLNQEIIEYGGSVEVHASGDLKEASDRFSEIHQNRPKAGENPRKTVVLSYSYNLVGQTLTLQDLVNLHKQKQSDLNSQNESDESKGMKL